MSEYDWHNPCIECGRSDDDHPEWVELTDELNATRARIERALALLGPERKHNPAAVNAESIRAALRGDT